MTENITPYSEDFEPPPNMVDDEVSATHRYEKIPTPSPARSVPQPDVDWDTGSIATGSYITELENNPVPETWGKILKDSLDAARVTTLEHSAMEKAQLMYFASKDREMGIDATVSVEEAKKKYDMEIDEPISAGELSLRLHMREDKLKRMGELDDQFGWDRPITSAATFLTMGLFYSLTPTSLGLTAALSKGFGLLGFGATGVVNSWRGFRVFNILRKQSKAMKLLPPGPSAHAVATIKKTKPMVEALKAATPMGAANAAEEVLIHQVEATKGYHYDPTASIMFGTLAPFTVGTMGAYFKAIRTNNKPKPILQAEDSDYNPKHRADDEAIDDEVLKTVTAEANELIDEADELLNVDNIVGRQEPENKLLRELANTAKVTRAAQRTEVERKAQMEADKASREEGKRAVREIRQMIKESKAKEKERRIEAKRVEEYHASEEKRLQKRFDEVEAEIKKLEKAEAERAKGLQKQQSEAAKNKLKEERIKRQEAKQKLDEIKKMIADNKVRSKERVAEVKKAQDFEKSEEKRLQQKFKDIEQEIKKNEAVEKERLKGAGIKKEETPSVPRLREERPTKKVAIQDEWDEHIDVRVKTPFANRITMANYEATKIRDKKLSGLYKKFLKGEQTVAQARWLLGALRKTLSRTKATLKKKNDDIRKKVNELRNFPKTQRPRIKTELRDLVDRRELIIEHHNAQARAINLLLAATKKYEIMQTNKNKFVDRFSRDVMEASASINRYVDNILKKQPLDGLKKETPEMQQFIRRLSTLEKKVPGVLKMLRRISGTTHALGFPNKNIKKLLPFLNEHLTSREFLANINNRLREIGRKRLKVTPERFLGVSRQELEDFFRIDDSPVKVKADEKDLKVAGKKLIAGDIGGNKLAELTDGIKKVMKEFTNCKAGKVKVETQGGKQ